MPTSRRRIQWTITMTKPSRESKTAKRIWKSADRRSVIARTADIQVSARRGKTTQELQREALSREEKGREVKTSEPRFSPTQFHLTAHGSQLNLLLPKSSKRIGLGEGKCTVSSPRGSRRLRCSSYPHHQNKWQTLPGVL